MPATRPDQGEPGDVHAQRKSLRYDDAGPAVVRFSRPPANAQDAFGRLEAALALGNERAAELCLASLLDFGFFALPMPKRREGAQ
jgi:hypothetical protein